MKQVIKPFNHTPASSFFRLACRAEFLENELLQAEADSTLLGLATLREFENNLKGRIKIKTSKVRGRRKNFNRYYKAPFTSLPSNIYYGIAIAIENMLERHYQLKSGETYVLLSKASMQFYQAANSRYSAL